MELQIILKSFGYIHDMIQHSCDGMLDLWETMLEADGVWLLIDETSHNVVIYSHLMDIILWVVPYSLHSPVCLITIKPVKSYQPENHFAPRILPAAKITYTR